MNEKLEGAYYEGISAYHAYVPKRKCPYKENPDLFNQWVAGWEFAEEQDLYKRRMIREYKIASSPVTQAITIVLACILSFFIILFIGYLNGGY